MSDEAGKGFVRRVTKSNFANFAPLLRDHTKNSSTPSPSPATGEFAAAQALFEGLKIHVSLPFTFSSNIFGEAPGTFSRVTEPTETDSVLVAEIPGPGRWSQVSFSKRVFHEFFGAVPIQLTHMNADGEFIHDIAAPIIKQSKNYCYELRAALGLTYPNKTDGRPIVVFLQVGPQRFHYKILMPSDPHHIALDTFLADNWIGASNRMRRITTSLDRLLGIWPAAQLPFIES